MLRVALVALLLLLLLAPAPAEAATTKVTVSASRSTLTVGGTFVLKVRTQRAAVGQKATVQRKVGSAWQRVRTAKLPASKKLDLTITPPLGTQRYRVKLAPKGNATAATSNTVTVTVRPVPQTAALALATTAIVGDAVTATATFTPTRAGRSVQLQSNASGTWQGVDTASQDAQGVATFPIPTDTAGARSYRAVAVPVSGLPAATSPVRTLTLATGGGWSDETVLVSHDVNGGPANSYSGYPSISDNGRFVVYTSDASDLVVDDTGNGRSDVFLWDRQTDTTVLVTRTMDGGGINADADAPDISGNGRYVAYTTSADNVVGLDNALNKGAIYRWDRLTGETILVTRSVTGGLPDSEAAYASIDESGTSIAFLSGAHDLTSDDYANVDESDSQIFRWTQSVDNQLGSIILISTRADGDPGTAPSDEPFISDAGHAIGFTSKANDLDVENGTPVTQYLDKAYVWRSSDNPRITALVSETDSAVAQDVTVTSISGTSGRVGLIYAGNDLTADDLGGDANVLVWQPGQSPGVILASHFVGMTTPADAVTVDLNLSATGTSGSFRSFAALSSGDAGNDYDLFAWHDGAVSRIGMAANGDEPNSNAGYSGLSGDGDWVVFESYATNLVAFATVSRQVFVTGTG